MKQFFLSFFLFATSIFVSGCQPKLTKKIEIELASFQADSVNEVNKEDIDKTISILQNRLKDVGFFYDENQFVVDSTAINKYTILLPENIDEKQIGRILTTEGKLEFWKVEDLDKCTDFQTICNNDFIRQKFQNCYMSSSPSLIGCFPIEDKEAVLDTLNTIMLNKSYCLRFGIDDLDNNTSALYILKKVSPINGAVLTGKTITEASAEDTHGWHSVTLKMNNFGAQKWAQITENNIGKPLAVVLDDVVYSVPMVNSRIDGGLSIITGDFSKDEAKEMAINLNSGQLPLRVTILK